MVPLIWPLPISSIFSFLHKRTYTLRAHLHPATRLRQGSQMGCKVIWARDRSSNVTSAMCNSTDQNEWNWFRSNVAVAGCKWAFMARKTTTNCEQEAVISQNEGVHLSLFSTVTPISSHLPFEVRNIGQIAHFVFYTHTAVADPGFPRGGGANPKGGGGEPIIWPFSPPRKLHENKEILGQKGEAIPRAPLDPPLLSHHTLFIAMTFLRINWP